MQSRQKTALLIVLSSVLQTLIFPLAGPLPKARAVLAWFALVPWFLYLLSAQVRTRREAAESVLWSYGCGVLWYFGHCYWIYQTMHQYGGLSEVMAAVTLLLFCLYLGLYHALVGLFVGLLRRHWHTNHACWPLLLALVWVAVELGRAHVTSFPWDLLGYSQIDHAALTALVPYTGVYGISFLVALLNGMLAAGFLHGTERFNGIAYAGAFLVALLAALGVLVHAPLDPANASAVLVQPNLGASIEDRRQPRTVPLETRMFRLTEAAFDSSGKPTPSVVLWPEAPTTYEWNDPAFRRALEAFSSNHDMPMIVDANTVEPDARVSRQYRLYNSAAIVVPKAGLQRRYDKIHLVPFGEFTPYADLFSFASGLTQEVGTFDRGHDRTPLSDLRHRYGTFICYESIFPDEVRQFALRGADVLVNLSDDGWYGDTSAPFQHINMARMRAIENRRWLLRDTNTGISASIDPHGNIREAAPRHVQTAAVMHFAFSNVLTFYTLHGDVFAYACTLVAVLLLASAIVRPRSEPK